jgi:hypothetical protein
MLHGGQSWVAAALAEGSEVAETVADFQLEDVNPSSATNGQLVSPRDFQGMISGWYFGRST